MGRVFYRLGQFWRGATAKVSPADYQAAAGTLPPAALPLFCHMPVDAQRHSLNVLYSVWAAGYRQPDLAAAALLHDCGKVAAAEAGVSIGLWLRGPLLLLDRFFPQWAARWALAEPVADAGTFSLNGWRYALFVQREHAAIGAAWAEQAGCSPLTCWLIAHHQGCLSPGEAEKTGAEARRLLAVLQAADGGN
jgi:hypothetical protein